MKETSYQEALNIKLREFNERSAFAISLITTTLFFLLLIMDYIRWKSGLFYENPDFLILAYIHIPIVLYFIPLLNTKLKFISIQPRGELATNALLCLPIVYITLVPFSFLALYIHNEMIVFVVFICVINLFFETDIKNKLYINIGIFIAITVVNIVRDEAITTKILSFIEMLSIVSFTYILAKNRYENSIEMHENEIQLQIQNELLLEQNKLIVDKNKDLTSFAYATSHDLKEPLRMISSFIKILDKNLEGKIDGNDKRCMQYINGGIVNMEQMLDGLLKYAILDKDMEDVEEADLNEIFDKVINNLRILISQSEANIKVREDLPNIRTSKTLVVQLFQNLISNAIKFSKRGEAPVISIDFVQSDAHIIISISDKGRGIPKEEIENIFGIFNRLYSKDEISGHGIGLASCKKILEKIGGKIWVESEYKVGSTFFVQLPLETKA